MRIYYLIRILLRFSYPGDRLSERWPSVRVVQCPFLSVEHLSFPVAAAKMRKALPDGAVSASSTESPQHYFITFVLYSDPSNVNTSLGLAVICNYVGPSDKTLINRL